MAKKVRGTSSTHRPGGQGPSRSRKTSDASTSAAEGVSKATSDTDAAAEALAPVDAEYTELSVDESAPAATAAGAPPTSRRRRSRRNKAKADDLASRVTAENVWVRADLRRIGVVTVILFAALAVAWIVFYAMDVLNLY